MLFGGSRSGKTFLEVRAVCLRAIAAAESRHGIFRFRFNALKTSIGMDTLPKVMELCWPDVWDRTKLNKEDWFFQLPNGSEIWLSGLDDKKRVEKVLGKEYATLYFNECSEIPWGSRNIAMTRLAQLAKYIDVNGDERTLRLKAYYDCNPPSQLHWTYRVFQKRIDPITRLGLKNPDNYTSMQMNPIHNRDNLPAGYMDELENLPERERKRFLDGVFGDETEGSLWTYELLDQQRTESVPDLQRIIIAVDPSGCSGEEDERSDEVGIVVVGLGTNGIGYLLEDLSGKFGPGGERGWGAIVVNAFKRWRADRVVAERNYGGAMVKAVVMAAASSEDVSVPYKEVTASRGKVVRAEPVATLFEQDKIRVDGRFTELEDQLCAFRVTGYEGDQSPDRADAMIWGFSELFPMLARKDPQRTSGREPKVLTGRVRNGRLVRHRSK